MLNDSMIPTYQDKPIIPSVSAQRELDGLGKDLWFVEEVLKEGIVTGDKRKPNIIEKYVIRKGKKIKVVVAETDTW